MNTVDVSQLSQEVLIEICDLMGGDLFLNLFIVNTSHNIIVFELS